MFLKTTANQKMRALTIFNRWGDILYRDADYQGDWKGVVDGKRLPHGTYYFEIHMAAPYSFSIIGTVTIF